jgi:hypothetical protein
MGAIHPVTPLAPLVSALDVPSHHNAKIPSRSCLRTRRKPGYLIHTHRPRSTTAHIIFFSLWGVWHCVSSPYFPRSGGRAEVAVKKAKRLLMPHTDPTDNLNHECFLCAMLQLCNTPDPDCNVSPAQIVFGRPLRDALSFFNHLKKFSNICPLWRPRPSAVTPWTNARHATGRCCTWHRWYDTASMPLATYWGDAHPTSIFNRPSCANLHTSRVSQPITCRRHTDASSLTC